MKKRLKENGAGEKGKRGKGKRAKHLAGSFCFRQYYIFMYMYINERRTLLYIHKLIPISELK